MLRKRNTVHGHLVNVTAAPDLSICRIHIFLLFWSCFHLLDKCWRELKWKWSAVAGI